MRLFLGKNSFLPLDKVYFAGLMCTHLAAFRTAANIRKQGMALPLQKGRRPSVPKGTTLYLTTWTSPMTKRRFCRMSAYRQGRGNHRPGGSLRLGQKHLCPAGSPAVGCHRRLDPGGWGGVLPPHFGRKKQETFFQISCSVCRCEGGGYSVLKIRVRVAR